MNVDIPGGLRELQQVADRLLELNEWDKLDQQEGRSTFVSSFELKSSITEDLRSLYGLFLSLDLALREIVTRTDLNASARQRKSWERKLRDIENTIHACQINEKLIKS